MYVFVCVYSRKNTLIHGVAIIQEMCVCSYEHENHGPLSLSLPPSLFSLSRSLSPPVSLLPPPTLSLFSRSRSLSLCPPPIRPAPRCPSRARRCSCFTKSYSKYIRGTGSLLSTKFYDESGKCLLDTSDPWSVQVCFCMCVYVCIYICLYVEMCECAPEIDFRVSEPPCRRHPGAPTHKWGTRDVRGRSGIRRHR